jgi:hypothetical protein
VAVLGALASAARVPWVAGAALALAIRLPNLGDKLAMDAAAYLAGGFAWSEGLVPYRDVFDHKGPLNAELFVALDWLLPTSAVALRLLLLAAFVGSLVQLTVLLRRHVPGAAWPAVVVYAITASSPLFQGQDLNTEHIALPLAIAAADLADRARAARSGGIGAAVGVGVAVAAAVGLKSIFLLVAAPVPLILLARRRGMLAAACGGAVLAAAAMLVPYAAAGVLGDLREAVIDYSRDWAAANWQALLDHGAGEVLAYLAAFPSPVLPLLGLAVGLIALGDPVRRPAAACAAAAALGGWLAARAPGQSYDHYFLLPVPGLAVLCGLGVDALAARAPGLRRPLIALAVVPILAALAIRPVADALRIAPDSRWGPHYMPTLTRQDDAAQIVAARTEPDERIYVMTGGYTNSGQAIYWQARRAPASRFIFPGDVIPPALDEVEDDLARRPPAAVVLMPGAPIEPVAAAIEAGGLVEVAALEAPEGLVTTVYARPREGA